MLNDRAVHAYDKIHYSFLRFCMRSDRVSDLLKQNQFKVKTKTVWNILHKNLSLQCLFLQECSEEKHWAFLKNAFIKN